MLRKNRLSVSYAEMSGHSNIYGGDTGTSGQLLSVLIIPHGSCPFHYPAPLQTGPVAELGLSGGLSHSLRHVQHMAGT